MASAADAAIVSAKCIAAFEVKLATHDTATVEALIANDALMDAVNAQMKQMLSQAHVTPDSRRVFRTQDGLQVFDERGAKITGEITPNEIADNRPRWQEYSALKTEQATGMGECKAIHEYHAKLVYPRESLAEGEIS